MLSRRVLTVALLLAAFGLSSCVSPYGHRCQYDEPCWCEDEGYSYGGDYYDDRHGCP